MNADAILAQYRDAMRAYYTAYDDGRDDEAAAHEARANDLYAAYDRALMAECDAVVAAPLTLDDAYRMH